MTSIRRFLVIILLAVITLFNFVAALQGYRNGIDAAENLLDQEMANIAYLISQTVHAVDKTLNTTIKQDLAIQVWDKNNQLLRKTDNAPADPITTMKNGYGFASFNSYRWRTYAYTDKTAAHKVILAQRSDSRFIVSETVVLSAILPIVAGLPVVALLVWFIVGKGLQPLNILAEQLGRKKPQDLSPVYLANQPKEIAPLLTSLNDLFMRLSASFEREKRFSGDAAHELRTPLSALKIHLYNLQKELPDTDENIQAMNASLDRMTHLIEQMLLLYRINPDQFAAQFVQLELNSLCQEVIADMYPQISEKQQEIMLQGENVTLSGDTFALQTLVRNLVDNACKYTPKKGNIRVTTSANDNEAIFQIEDSGPGLTEDQHDRVFDRFYRLDGDQHTSSVTGCGLGLSICQHIVNLHQGTITLGQSSFATGLSITVKLPRKQEADHA